MCCWPGSAASAPLPPRPWPAPGIGALTIADHDRVAPSNLNRQLCALHSTLGRKRPRSSPRASATSTRDAG
jgi:molybdopterin/thiamine biosynthesis adenylyltransferase